MGAQWMLLRQLCRDALHTETLIESTDRILNHRDETEQRALASALNWVVVTLALVGVVQTLIAVADFRAQNLRPSQFWIHTSVDWIAHSGGIVSLAIAVLGLPIAILRYWMISHRRVGSLQEKATSAHPTPKRSEA